MDKKISELQQLTSISGDEMIPSALDGNNYKISTSTLRSGLATQDSVPTKLSQLTNDINAVSDANYVHTDNNYTTTEKTKLNNIVGLPSGGNSGDYLVQNEAGTAEWQTPQAPVGIEDLLSYGIEWKDDDSNSNPDCTRVGNMLLHKSLPIQNNLRGCVYNNNGINYYLDKYNWAYKEDGTESVLDGTDGSVMVDTGSEFFYKSGTKEDGTNWVRISTIQIDSSWIRVPRMLISAYRCTVDTTESGNYKAVSVVNTSTAFRGGNNDSTYDQYLETDPYRTMLGKPRTSVNRSTMRTYARNNSMELLSYEQYKAVLYWLPIIEYATFNMQKDVNEQLTSDGYKQGGLGKGLTNVNWSQWVKYNSNNPYTPCGFTNEIGNFTGEKSLVIPSFEYDNNGVTVTTSSQTVKVNRYRGIENIFGDIWTNLEGVITQGVLDENGEYTYKNVYTTSDPTYYGDTTTQLNDMRIAGRNIYTDGYIKRFDLGSTAEPIANAVGGSATTFKCDYNYTGAKDSSLRLFLVGGAARYGGYAGLGCFDSSHGVSTAAAGIGFRIVKVLD